MIGKVEKSKTVAKLAQFYIIELGRCEARLVLRLRAAQVIKNGGGGSSPLRGTWGAKLPNTRAWPG